MASPVGRREMGIRLVLGAGSRRDLVRLMARRTLVA
jgi:hypothetical protein